MKSRPVLTLFILLLHLPSFAQGDLFLQAFEDFSAKRIWAYEEIPMKWTMPGLLQADLNEGVNYLFEETPALAENSFTSVLEKDSTIWQAYYYRAASRKLQKKHRLAISDLRRALTLHGDFYEGYVELAKIYHLRGYHDESETAINKAIRLDNSKGTAHYVKGDIKLTRILHGPP